MTKSPLPAGVLEQHTVVLGKTRSGKSSVMRGMVEGLLDNKMPVCIIDPKGDWWGIKLSADGKGPGYAVVIFGGEHADVPINAHSGAHIAELVATGNRPCLIDLGGWMIGERTRFYIDFASMLFRMTRGNRYLVIDECHNFAPKGKIMDPDAGKMLHWSNRLASEGLGKGLHVIAASQRPQKVHNDFLTSCETIVAMKVTHPRDREAIAEWVDGCGDPAIGKEILKGLAQVARGTGWAWSPEINFGPKVVAFPMFRTYDSFKPQPAGQDAKLKGWASVDLEDVKAKLAGVVKEAEQNDPKKLRARIAELERDAKKGHAAPVADPGAEERGFERGYEMGWNAACNEFKAARTLTVGHLENALDALRGVSMPVAKHSDQFAKNRLLACSASRTPDASQLNPKRMTPARQPRTGEPVSLPPGERATLTACAQHEGGCTREQLSILTQYKRSTRDAYVQRLREKGYIEAAGDRITATAAGIDALGSTFEPLPTGEELRRHWLERLPDGERAVLQVVIDAYPDAVGRDAFENATGYKRSTRDAYIQRLKARQLVIVSRGGGITAADALFDG